MTSDQMQGLFRIILAGWASQRQRLTGDDVAEMTKLYAAGLMDLDFDVAHAAVIRIVHTSKFLPTVAEIREAAGVIKHGNRRAGAEAWGEVIAKIRRFGSYRTPGIEFYFEDPITARVVKALNWAELCSGEGSQIMADRARFIDAYDQISDAARADAAATPSMESDMLTMQKAPPPRALPSPRPVLSSAERIRVLQEVLDEVRANNPDIARALPPPQSEAEPS